MKKRLFWGVMVLSAFVLLSFGLFPHWPSYTLDYFQNEPLFKGKPPTYWSRVISSSEIEFDPNAASELRAGGTEAVPVLMELLQHENASIRAQAARILGSMSESSASAVPALKKAASDHNRQVSQAANEALRRIGVETVDWQELASKEGRFFVLMPGKPSEERFPAHMAENIDVVSFYVWMLLPRLAHFAVAYSDHPDVAIKNLTDKESLDAALELFIDDQGNELLSDKPILLNNHVGRERVLQTPRGTMTKVRAYWVKPRLYRVVSIGMPEEANSPEASKFLDSFKLLKD